MVLDPVSGALVAVFGTAFDGPLQHGVGGLAHRVDDRRRIRALADPDRVVRRVADELSDLRRTEFRGLSDQDWSRVVDAVRESLALVRWVDLARTPTDLVNADRLVAHVHAVDSDVFVRMDLGARERAAYEHVLTGSCAGLAELARSIDRLPRSSTRRVSSNAVAALTPAPVRGSSSVSGERRLTARLM